MTTDWKLKINKDGNSAIEFDADAYIVDPAYLSEADEQSSSDVTDLPNLDYSYVADQDEKTILNAEQSILDADDDLGRKAMELLNDPSAEPSDIAKLQLYSATLDSVKTPPVTKKKRKRSRRLKCKQVCPDAYLPQRGTAGSAGLDLFAITSITIPQRIIVKVRTGLAIQIPTGCHGHIGCRSSLAAKGITVRGGVIDSDYRGEIIVMLFNDGPDEIYLEKKDKFAQLIILPYIQVEPEMVEKLNSSGRGEGGFGSTDVISKEEEKGIVRKKIEELEKAALKGAGLYDAVVDTRTPMQRYWGNQTECKTYDEWVQIEKEKKEKEKLDKELGEKLDEGLALLNQREKELEKETAVVKARIDSFLEVDKIERARRESRSCENHCIGL